MGEKVSEKQVRALTGQQEIFVNAYAATMNASEAARVAGYSNPKSIGYRVLRTPAVQDALSTMLAERVMDPGETLGRLAQQARCEYADYISADGKVDLAGLQRDGLMHLVKSIKDTRYGKAIEFYDGQAALQLIGRHQRLFVDGVELSGGVEISENAATERLNSRIDSIAARLRAQSGTDGAGADAGGSEATGVQLAILGKAESEAASE